MAKASAVAHAIQGLVKYHGLKNTKLRIPFHDSISVCVKQLTTTTTIDFNEHYSQNLIEINGRLAGAIEASRILSVVSPLQNLAKRKEHFRVVSKNNLPQGKGLGFSASAFASIARASATALGLDINPRRLSEIARLGAGSASRSLVGGFSIWYANKNGRSFAEPLPTGKDLRLAMAVVPIPSGVRTDLAHEESTTSPFFKARLTEVRRILPKMKRAIRWGSLETIGRLAEAESLSLHAITMTGKRGLLLMSPETLAILRGVVSMRETDHLPVWYSLDTGPSVFVNTRSDFLDQVSDGLRNYTNFQVVKSGVGGPANTIDEHLF